MCSKNKGGNIILFPQLIDRFLDKATDARENGELAIFREASELAEYMLLENLGEYTEVLQFYVLSLVQLEEYEKVCEILDAVLSDPQMPLTKQKELEEIYKSCKLLRDAVEQEQEEQIIRAKVEEKMQTEKGFIKNLIVDLDTGDFDRQLQVIEQLKYADDPLVIAALRNYCILPHVDPFLKTFALRALKFLGVKDKVLVYKFDQLLEVSPDDIPADEDGLYPEQRKVLELVTQQAYHEDPIFVSFVMQVWVEYLFSAFPLIPSMKNPASWAAALHFIVAGLLAQDPTHREVAKKYGSTVQTLNKRIKDFQRVLSLRNSRSF